MTHLELENLASEYLEGLLDTARKGEAEAHLSECHKCRELVENLRQAIELCHAAAELEPPPWLVTKILRATIGERKPRLREQLAALLKPATQPRFAYAVAMTVFALSVIVNAAGLDLRTVRVEDLNPRTWLYRANRAGHLLLARAERFYYDLRVVYEIESRMRQLRAQPSEQEGEPSKPEPPAAAPSSQAAPPQLALTLRPESFSSERATIIRSYPHEMR